MKNLIESMFYCIVGHGRGWVFSSGDMADRFSRQQADNLLSELVSQGKVRRLARGLYDYPRYSELLKRELGPDIDQAAAAYARKFNWRIEASGETAMNLLGLSTQVPAAYIYLSDGPSRNYEVLGIALQFKKTVLKNIGFKYRESSLIVQALKALGKEHITVDVINKIRAQIDATKYSKILKDTRTTTNWIYEIIKEICRSADE